MSGMLSSVTVVAVVGEDGYDAALVTRMLDDVVREAGDVDFVLVANGVGTDVTRSLKAFAESLPDTTVVFLSDQVHDDIARLVGIDHATNDYILFCTPTDAEIGVLPALLAPLKAGYDLVIGDQTGALVVERSPFFDFLFRIYVRIYRSISDLELERRPTGLRVFSRDAALFVASRSDAEVALRARSIGSAFPATAVPVPQGRANAQRAKTKMTDWSKGMRLLLSVSALPIRSATFVCMAGGLLSVLYSAYVILVFFLKPDVEAGWTTISLQVAGMMFLFSLVFLFLCEYVIQIHAANPPRSRRHLVVREFRSPLSRRSLRLNVVDASGQFQIGAPADLFDRTTGAAST